MIKNKESLGQIISVMWYLNRIGILFYRQTMLVQIYIYSYGLLMLHKHIWGDSVTLYIVPLKPYYIFQKYSFILSSVKGEIYWILDYLANRYIWSNGYWSVQFMYG